MKYTDKLFAYDNLFPTEQMKIDVGELFQVSELSLVPGGEISLHHQQCDEITFAISGSAQFYSDNICNTVTANQLHFIRKGFTHRIVASSNENFRFVCIGLNPNRQNAAVKALYAALASQPYMITTDNGTVKNLSEFLIREFYIIKPMITVKTAPREPQISLCINSCVLSIENISRFPLSNPLQKPCPTANITYLTYSKKKWG